MFDFTEKTVLVTGGTSGIGREIAIAFLRAGANPIAAGLPGKQSMPEGIRVETLDITQTGQVNSLLEGLDALDVLVNSAGMIRRDDEFDLEVFQQVMDVNLTGTMRACSAARPKLRATGGAIVNIASMYSFFGGPRVPAYTASKGAVAQLTRSLAVAWAGEGIRVNAVAPGWIATPLTQPVQEDPVRSAPILSRTPLARWGRPEEIAGPVLFLCSEAASFITGAVLPVDGGYSAA